MSFPLDQSSGTRFERRVLLVEDDDGDARLVRHAIESDLTAQIRFRRAASLKDATEQLAVEPADAILLDLSLPDAAGAETLRTMMSLELDCPIVVLTGLDDVEIGQQLIREGAQDYLPKSEVTPGSIRRAILHAVERHSLGRELRDARREALRASGAKSEFVASISHEIRTPMNAILGMADLLSHTELDEQQQSYVQIFQRSGNALLSLINNVLDMSTIEHGKLRVSEIEFCPIALIEETAETFAFAAHKKKLGFAIDIASDVPSKCIGDPDRIRQVLANLIGNALKFTVEGEIHLRVWTAKEGTLNFSVEDTGLGVPDAQYAKLFEPFEQGGEHIHHQFGGTGLGLTLCKELVEAMGGSIEAVPGEDCGSRFEFDIQVESIASVAAATSELAGKRVAIAIGHPGERALLKCQLEAAGAFVISSDSGTSMAEVVKREHGKLDAAVVDIRLREVLVLDTDKAARAQWPRESIILVPLDHRVGDLSRCEQEHVHRLMKPVAAYKLIELLSASEPAKAVAKTKPELMVDLDVMRILLVDDSPDNLMLAQTFLRDANATVETAANGAEAIRRFRHDGAYDLILMDMQMPIVDGYEATREIRQQEKFSGAKAVPIIALTADAFSEHREKARLAGCTGHLSKPISRDSLITCVSDYADYGRAKAVPNALPEVDPAIADLVPGFVARRFDDLAQISAAIELNDLDQVRRVAHNLKGTGLSFGFPRLSEIGASVESAAISGDVDGIRAGIEEMTNELEPYQDFRG